MNAMQSANPETSRNCGGCTGGQCGLTGLFIGDRLCSSVEGVSSVVPPVALIARRMVLPLSSALIGAAVLSAMAPTSMTSDALALLGAALGFVGGHSCVRFGARAQPFTPPLPF